jgi:hypothetical protein
LGTEILKGIERNEIIVLIVNIVTLFLNAAKPFSLFNATQILSIPITENPHRIHRPYRPYRHSSLSVAMFFSLINVVQILYSKNINRP